MNVFTRFIQIGLPANVYYAAWILIIYICVSFFISINYANAFAEFKTKVDQMVEYKIKMADDDKRKQQQDINEIIQLIKERLHIEPLTYGSPTAGVESSGQ